MAGTLNSATIGIQNGTKTIGLAANYNANYVHSNLAIQFSRAPDWLTVTPNHASVPPGESFVFDVKFDSTGRNGGDLVGAVVLTTNIPSQAEERVPAVLHVDRRADRRRGPGVLRLRHAVHRVLVRHAVPGREQRDRCAQRLDVTSDDPSLFVEDPLGRRAGVPRPRSRCCRARRGCSTCGGSRRSRARSSRPSPRPDQRRPADPGHDRCR